MNFRDAYRSTSARLQDFIEMSVRIWVFRKHLARDLSGDTKITQGQIVPSSQVRNVSVDLCSQDFTHLFIHTVSSVDFCADVPQ